MSMALGFHQRNHPQPHGESRHVSIFPLALFSCGRHHVTLCSISRAYYGSVNFFGGPSSTAVKASAKLKQLEEENEDAMFVILSDVWLDNGEVLEKLNLMFSGRLGNHNS